MAIFYLFLRYFCQALTVIIILEAILSWFPQARRSRLMGILNGITSPFLNPLRKIIPSAGMVDFSPFLAIILLQLIINLIP